MWYPPPSKKNAQGHVAEVFLYPEYREVKRKVPRNGMSFWDLDIEAGCLIV